jgi:DNA-binding transcriptional LysR family regulator
MTINQLEDMRLFVRTVDAGSFTAAAEGLGLSKQFVSKRLIALEARLGVRLLLRTTRTLRVTDTGASYYEQAGRVIHEVDGIEQSIARQNTVPRGRLRISAPMTFGTLHLSPALPRFLTAWPDVAVELVLDDRVVDLVADGFDVGVRIGTLPDSSLIAQRVALVEMATCCSPDYLRRHGAPVKPAELRQHACLLYGHKRHVDWQFAIQHKARSVAVTGRLCANNGEIIRDAALAGLGFAQLPTFIVGTALQNGTLVSVLDGYRPAAAGVHVVHPAHRESSLAVRAFADFMRSTFAGPLRGLPAGTRRVAKPSV